MNRYTAQTWRAPTVDEVRLASVMSEIFSRSDVSHGALLFEKSDGHYKLGEGSTCFPPDLLSICQTLAEKNKHPGLLLARNRHTPFAISAEEPEITQIREVGDFLGIAAEAKFLSFYFLPLRDLNGNLFVSAIASRQRKLNDFELRLIHSYCLDALEKLATEMRTEIGEKSMLSPRERECLISAAKGFTEKQSGKMLSISPFTVRAHLQNCKRKLGARDKLSAIITGLNLGEIMPADIEAA